MSDELKQTSGLAEEAVSFETKQPSLDGEARPVLRANPPTREPDWNAIINDVRRDFPKTLARLAE